MQINVDSLCVSSVQDNISTLIMSVSFRSNDSKLILETKTFQTTFNAIVDGEKEKAENELKCQLTAYTRHAQFMEDYNLNSEGARAVIESAAVEAHAAFVARI